MRRSFVGRSRSVSLSTSPCRFPLTQIRRAATTTTNSWNHLTWANRRKTPTRTDANRRHRWIWRWKNRKISFSCSTSTRPTDRWKLIFLNRSTNAISVRFDLVRWKLCKRIKKTIVSNIENTKNRRQTPNVDLHRRLRFRRSIVRRPPRCCPIVRRRSCAVCANIVAILCEECACISSFISRITSRAPTTTSSSPRQWRRRTFNRRIRLKSYSNVQFVRRCSITKKRWLTIWSVCIRRKVCANVPNVIRGSHRNGIWFDTWN